MTDMMHYAFVDESGTVGIKTGTHFLIIGVMCGKQVRDIEIPVKRAQKKFGTSLASDELKANASREAVVMRLLSELIKEDIEIVAVAVDQKAVGRPAKDGEEIYRKAVSRVVYHLVERWPRIEICLDQRYTNDGLRYDLERRIREEIVDLPQKIILIRQLNSQARRGLQAADFIAWAFFQKYERGDHRFVDVFAAKIVEEEVLMQKTGRKASLKG